MAPTLLTSAHANSRIPDIQASPSIDSNPEYMKFIQVNDLRFDPLAGGPSIPSSLKYSSISSSVLAYYIVQFKGPITTDMKAALSGTGASILGYVNYNAFVVKADGPSIEKTNLLGSVRWVGNFEPAYKLSPRLSSQFDQLLQKGEVMRSISSGGTPQINDVVDQNIDVQVLAFEPSQLKGIMSKISMLGGSDIAWSHNSSGMVRAKIDRNMLAQLAREPGVMWIDRQQDHTVNNDIARWVVQSGDTTGYSTPIHDNGIYGTNQTVTVGDTGLDYDQSDFSDPNHSIPGPDHRKVTAYYTPSGAIGDLSDNGINHGTHVSGSVAGDDGTWHVYDGNPLGSNGTTGPHDGQAFNATLQIQDMSPDGYFIDPPIDYHTMFQAALDRGSYIHTNSWGSPGNDYTLNAQATDDFLWNNREFIVLFSAGNDGPGLATLSQDATAKNIISVGASMNGQDLQKVASFSSRGPAADGRIKPDVMAPGVGIWSAEGDDPSAPQNQYWQLSGTSMATPTVAGSVALIREYYMTGWYPTGTRNLAQGFVPSSALVKATLINSAREMTGDGAYRNSETYYPNNEQGWGRVTLDDALFFRGDSSKLFVDDNASGLGTGSSHDYLISVGDSSVPFEVTLVWSDYPGMPFTSPNLVNDLDLTVTSPSGTVYRGNAYQGSNPGQSEPDSTKVDHVNNVESVLVISAATPGVWHVRVSGFNVPEGPQPYAIVATGGLVSNLGTVKLDKGHYQSSALVNVTVADTGLDVNPNAPDSATVNISSTTESTWEAVTVTETANDSSIFLGSIHLRNSPVPVSGNGKLEVQNGDTITVRYLDANNGTGSGGYVYDTAIVDNIPPVISNLTVASLRYSTVTILWATDEPSDSSLGYGTSTPPGTVSVNARLTLAHRMSLSKLVSNATYWFYVVSTDEAGNVATVDNSSHFYSFRTPAKPPMPQASDEWPTFHNNPARSGVSPSNMTTPLAKQWQMNQSSHSTFTSPVMVDGMLFTTAIDGSITARDAHTGSILWHQKLGVQYTVCGTPAVAGGVVYACFADIGLSGYYGKLFALDELTGYTLWSAGNEEAFNIIINTAVTVADGLVFVSTQGPEGYGYANPNAVIAFGALNGTVVWAYETNDTSSGGPAVGGGRLFVPTSTTNEIYGLDEFTGALLWTRSLDGKVLGSPTAADGCVFAGTLGGTMYALDEIDGSIVWQVGGWGLIQHSTPVFNGTTVFFGTSAGSVCALDSANGSIVWTLSTDDIIESSLAYANGYLFYSSLLGFLKVVNASSGKVNQTLRLGTFSMSTSSPAVSDGWVWLESDDGKTFGFLGRVQVGLQVTPVLQSKDASPGMTVAYYVDIKNTGTSGADVFDVDATLGLNGWPVELFESDGSTPLSDSNSNGLPDTGSLSTGSSTTIVADVSVPSSSVANDLETSLIRFTSSNDPSISKTASLFTYLAPPGVAMSPNSYNASAPGRTEKAVIELRNTGALVDVFNLNVTSSLGWSASLFQADGVTPFTDTDGDGVNDTGSVPGLRNHTIVVSVTVPSGAGLGTIEETSVRATSTRDVNSSARVLMTIELPGLPTDDWPTSQHDSARTGAASSSFALPMSKSWIYAGGSLYYPSTSPVVTGNTVYYGSVNGNLTAIDCMTGREKWTIQLGMVGRPMSSPTMGSGVLYIGYTSPNAFESISQIDAQTGLVDWTFYTDDSAGFGTPVLKHGVLYAADRTGVLYALDPNLGTYKWKRGLGGAVELGPSVIDGFVMAGTLQNDVFALALNGDVAWKTTVDAPVNGPIVGGGGRVYFSDAVGSIYALNSQTGSQIWKERVGDGSRQLQLAYSEGVLYASGTIVAALNSTTGVYLWIHGPTVTYWTTLVVDRGLFFTTGEDGILYVLNSTHGNSSASFSVHALGVSHPPALMKGYLYVTDNSGGLTRFKFAGAGDPSNLALTPNSNSVVIGGSKTLSASVQDRYGNTLSNQTFNWSVESGSGTIFKVGERGEQAMFVAGLISGSSTITVSIGSHNASISIDILPGAPHDLTITPDEAAIGVGDSLAFSATVRDLFGNMISDSHISWSSTIGTIGSNAVFFAGTTAGAGFVRATYAALTAEVAITVLPGALFNISLSPSELRLEPQATAVIAAAAYDGYGNELPESVFLWTTTIGSLLPTGVQSQIVFKAGYAVGTGIVSVTSGSHDASASIEIVPGSPRDIAVAPNEATVGVGMSLAFSATVRDLFGNMISDSQISWSSTIGTIGSNGMFVAGTTAGVGLVRATYAALTAEVAITVLPGALFNISLSPSELRLEPQATAVIAAAAYDGYGNELPESVFLWTTTIGSLLSTGIQSQMVLQAGFTVGTGVVTVSIGGIDTTAQVVVVPGPVASLIVSPPVLVLDTGAFMDLEARAYDAFGNLVPDAIFEWSSTGEGDWSLSLTSNSIASFYSGTSGGNAVITVTLGSKVVTLVITVNPEPVKQTDLALIYAFGATAVVLACIVVVLLLMLFRRRPGMTAPSPEAREKSPDSDAPN